jgi:hypothetical protein
MGTRRYSNLVLEILSDARDIIIEAVEAPGRYVSSDVVSRPSLSSR